MNPVSEQILRRNQALLLCDYVLFGVGMAFLGPTTLLPSLVRELGGSPFVVGSLGAIMSGGWLLPQLFAGRYLANRPQVKGLVVGSLLVSRACQALMVPTLILLAGPAPDLALVVMLVAMAGFMVADAVGSVGWLDLVARAIPVEWRGRAMGAAQSLSSLVAIGAGMLVKVILARPEPFPANHVLLVLLAAVFFSLSVLALGLIVEPRGVAQGNAQPKWQEYLPRLAAILRTEPRFAWLTVVRWLAGFSDMAGAFYVLFAAERLHVAQENIGLFISAGVVGSMLCGAVLGPLSDRKGNALAVKIIAALRCLAPLLALLAPLVAGNQPGLATGVFTLIFGLIGMTTGAHMVGFMNYLLEIAPPSERSLYVGLSNTLGGVMTLAPLIGGWLVQVASYELLFVVSLALGITGLAVAMRGPRGVVAPRAAGAAAGGGQPGE